MQTKCVDIHISMHRTSNKEWNAYFVILNLEIKAKKSLKIPKGKLEAVNRRIEDKQQSTKRYTENQRLKSKKPQKKLWSTSN